MGWSYQLKTRDVKVGEKTIPMGGSLGGSGLGATGSTTIFASGQPAGEYPLEARIRLEILHAPLGTAVPPVWSKDLTLKSTLKVVAQNADEMVKLIDQPELAEQIKKSLRIDKFEKQPDGSYEFSVHIQKPPVNLAFSASVRSGGKEFHMWDFTANTSSNMVTSLHLNNIGQIAPGKVTVIFRSEPSIARRTTDLVEMWKGEIVLDNVELTEQKK